MKNLFASGLLLSGVIGLSLLTATPARAGIGACGNIDVDAHGMCEVKVDGCDIECTPLKVQAACAARLEVSCEADCPQLPSVSCTGSCQGSCEADCKAKPAEFDCTASCKADATAKCDAQCASDANQARCSASCRATFAAECDTSCSVTPGSASCTAKCQGSCKGSCTADSRLECQVNCQADGYAGCQTQIQGGCKGDCSNPRGALFCDGEYVDANGKVDECIAALKAALPTITVDASAQGESSCTGSSCQASGQAQASANCAFSPRKVGAQDALGALGVLAALAAVGTRRRKPR